MPSGGRFQPGFERHGGGKPALETILEALNQARGEAYDTTEDSVVYAENEAMARVIWSLFEQNERFKNQFDPLRTTDLLPELEETFGSFPAYGASSGSRRRELAKRVRRIGESALNQYVKDVLSEELGDVYVDLEHVDITDAVQWWAGGTPNPNPTLVPWYSTTEHVLVKVARNGMLLADFYAAIGRVAPFLDWILPATNTWSWYEAPEGYDIGFFLDQPNNLDHQAFD